MRRTEPSVAFSAASTPRIASEAFGVIVSMAPPLVASLVATRRAPGETAPLRREALEHSAVRCHGEDGGHDGDPVLASQLRGLAPVDLDQRVGLAGGAPLPCARLAPQAGGARQER